MYLNFRLLLEKMVSVIDHQADDKQAVVIEKVGTGATDVGKVQKPETEEEKEEERGERARGASRQYHGSQVTLSEEGFGGEISMGRG